MEYPRVPQAASISTYPSGTNSVDLPKPSQRLLRGFNWYVPRYIRRNFNAVRVANPILIQQQIARDEAVVCFLNHASWWDPLMAFLLNQLWMPERTVFAPIDEAALRQYSIFRHLGFYGIDRDSREGAKHFLRISKQLLRNPTTALWITPSGRFDDVRTRSEFQPGLAHLASTTEHVSFLPIAIEYPFWDERTPEALVEFGAPLHSRPGVSKAEWRVDLETTLADTQASLSQKAISRDPEQFAYTLDGSAGVGGWYDCGRRLKSLLTGRRFRNRHRQGTA